MLPVADDREAGFGRAELRMAHAANRYVRREVPLVSAATHLTGRCGNDLFCTAAIRKDDVVVLPGKPFVCKECQKPLSAQTNGRAQAARAQPGMRRRDRIPMVTQGNFLRGRCTNTKRCFVARSGHFICVRLGNVFVCPECSRPLAARLGPPESPGWMRALTGSVIAGFLLLGTSAVVGAMQVGRSGLGAPTVLSESRLAALQAPPALLASLPGPGGSVPGRGHGSARYANRHHSAAMAP